MGEPERVRVVAYQNHLDRTPLPHGANRNDLFISGCKVSQPTGSGSGSEDRDFTFDAAFGPETVPVSVVRSEVPLAVDAFLDGINAVLLVLGASGSGKDELLAGTPATGGAERWEGLVEHLIRSVYAALRESGEGGVASGAARLQLQFLHIDSERVQDLLEPDCHSHNLQLADDDEAGTLVREARPEVLKGEAHAISLYRRGVQSVHTLGRYHAVSTPAIIRPTASRARATCPCPAPVPVPVPVPATPRRRTSHACCVGRRRRGMLHPNPHVDATVGYGSGAHRRRRRAGSLLLLVNSECRWPAGHGATAHAEPRA